MSNMFENLKFQQHERNEFDISLDNYFNHFGEGYPIPFGAKYNSEEIISDIEKRIASNKKAIPIKYDSDKTY